MQKAQAEALFVKYPWLAEEIGDLATRTATRNERFQPLTNWITGKVTEIRERPLSELNLSACSEITTYEDRTHDTCALIEATATETKKPLLWVCTRYALICHEEPNEKTNDDEHVDTYRGMSLKRVLYAMSIREAIQKLMAWASKAEKTVYVRAILLNVATGKKGKLNSEYYEIYNVPEGIDLLNAEG